MAATFGEMPPRLYPISDNGSVLRGGEKVKVYQNWSGCRHYLCHDGESWTSNAEKAGIWVVDPVYNFFEFIDSLGVMLIESQCGSFETFTQLNLF